MSKYSIVNTVGQGKWARIEFQGFRCDIDLRIVVLDILHEKTACNSFVATLRR